jgi:branched-subunit amino acid aminotransferase/4-amino-4-deoxychorismate lyase
MGVFLDDNGNLAESAIANVAVVRNSRFLTPLPTHVLEGTTVKRVLSFCADLVQSGELSFAGRADIPLESAYTSDEMMLLGGDSVIAITSLDGHVAGVGKVTQKIADFLDRDKTGGAMEL